MESNFKRWIVAALPLAMTCTVCAQGKVTDVSTRHIEGALAVHIGGSDLAKPTTRWDNGALVLGFQAHLDAQSKTWKPDAGGIKAISFGQNGGSVDVAVRPTKSKDPQIVQVADGWLVYFEDGISSSVPPLKTAAASAQKGGPVNFAPVNPRDFRSKALVTLNFVDTDIVQILKALAMQANVNVAMGPDVSGKVTINLENVPVDDAMDMVTILGGVRYAYVNNTYVVSSGSRFGEMMKGMTHRTGMSSETRVIPLFSREGNQIKAAILKMVPPSTVDGEYDLVLPSEKLSVQQSQSLTPGAGDDKSGDKAGGPAAGNQTDTKVQQASGDANSKKDDYIVLVGTPDRMEAVDHAVRSLDEQICEALGIKIGENQGQVQQVFVPEGIQAQDLVKALAGDGKNEFDNVQLVATPASSVSKQSIVLSGRQADVSRVMTMLSELDKTQDNNDTHYEVVGLKYAQPNVLFQQVMQEVPGVHVSILPPPIDPNVGIDYKSTTYTGPNAGASGSNNSSGSGGDGGSGGSGGNSGGSGGNSSGGSGSGSSGGSGSGGQLGSNGQVNPSQVKVSTKSNSIPMKLLLRGTADQIDAAKKYIAMVDLAPKQVAVELRVMELTKAEALKVGLDWSVLTGGTLHSLDLNQALGDNTTAGGIKTDLQFHGGGSASILGLLDSLSTNTNVLARPSILVNDGVPTNIFVGDEVRYVKSILTSANNPPTIETDEIDVGVDFTVTARVGDGGNIAVDMAPTLKVLEGFTNVPGGGQLPQTSRRSAESLMNIKSGETIAIGGLIQDQDRKEYGGIPFLKDLPIIGRIFGRTTNTKSRSEVVFFVTVKEVNEDNRQGAANPNQAERENTQWPGNKNGKKGG